MIRLAYGSLTENKTSASHIRFVKTVWFQLQHGCRTVTFALICMARISPFCGSFNPQRKSIRLINLENAQIYFYLQLINVCYLKASEWFARLLWDRTDLYLWHLLGHASCDFPNHVQARSMSWIPDNPGSHRPVYWTQHNVLGLHLTMLVRLSWTMIWICNPWLWKSCRPLEFWSFVAVCR